MLYRFTDPETDPASQRSLEVTLQRCTGPQTLKPAPSLYTLHDHVIQCVHGASIIRIIRITTASRAGNANGASTHTAMLCRSIDPETDSASQRVGNRLPRYWTPQYARLEHDRFLRRVKLGHANEAHATPTPTPSTRLSLPLPAFIPLQVLDTQVWQSSLYCFQ